MTTVLSIGIAVLDDIFPISTPIMPGEKHRASRVETVIGGNAANACRAIARLGGQASLITRFGADTAGEILRAGIEALGIDTSLSHAVPGCISSRSAIVIEPNGDRTIFNTIDPRLPEFPDWLPKTLPGTARAVLGDTRWEAGARHLLSLARAANIPGVFDGDRSPVEPGLVDLASHAVFSAQGLTEMTGVKNLGDSLRKLAYASSGFLAVTDGKNGVYAFEAGEIRHYPAFPIKAVDTLGAGDVWHGAFALGLGEGMSNGSAITFANATAAIKCTRLGGSSGTPDRREVMQFLAAQHINPEQAP